MYTPIIHHCTVNVHKKPNTYLPWNIILQEIAERTYVDI